MRPSMSDCKKIHGMLSARSDYKVMTWSGLMIVPHTLKGVEQLEKRLGILTRNVYVMQSVMSNLDDKHLINLLQTIIDNHNLMRYEVVSAIRNLKSYLSSSDTISEDEVPF